MPPVYETCIATQIFHPDVFFHTDRKTMQRPLDLAILKEEAVEVLCSFEALLREELRNAIGL